MKIVQVALQIEHLSLIYDKTKMDWKEFITTYGLEKQAENFDLFRSYLYEDEDLDKINASIHKIISIAVKNKRSLANDIKDSIDEFSHVYLNSMSVIN